MKDLPHLMLVTQRARMKPDFGSALQMALRGGARLIQLREKDLPDDELLPLAQRAKKLCEKYDATLIINGAPHIAQALNIGLHLPEGVPLPEEMKCGGASVHSLESAQFMERGRLARILFCAGETPALRYLIFGSVFHTQSHPGAAPAGLETLREVCVAVDVPVFAIGGITAQNAKSCLAVGAHGIAVIGAAWDAEDVQAVVQELRLAAEEHKFSEN